MAEDYRKIDQDTLEITKTRVSQQTRQRLEEEKQRAEAQMVKIQEWLDGINARLAVLDKV